MDTLIKAIVIEDESAAVSRLKKELNRIAMVRFEIEAVLESIEDSVKWLKNNNTELIFMDIHLTDGLSLEIFNQIKVTTPVIFTTAYDEYAINAFKLNSIDYLLKPIEPIELKDAIQRFLNTTKETKEESYLNKLMQLATQLRGEDYRSSFLVSFRHKMVMVDVSDVAFLYIKERGVFLKKKDGTEYVIEFFLDDLEKQLDPKMFYRANRQFLVSRSSIKEIEPYFNGRLILMIEPHIDSQVIICKEKAAQFKRWADY